MERSIALIVAEQIIGTLTCSGASEAEQHAALAVVRALIPVLPNATCSVEANESQPARDALGEKRD